MMRFLKKFLIGYLSVKVIFGSFAWLYFAVFHKKEIKIFGKENIPKEGRILFYSNHPSMTDPILILVLGFFPRVIWKPSCLPVVLAAEENFFVPHSRNVPFLGKIPFLRDLPLLRMAVETTAIKVNPTRSDAIALKQGVKILKEKNVLIFPEGARTKNEHLDEFRLGTALLVFYARPDWILPIKIKNANKVLPRGQNWPDWGKAFVEVIFGKPIEKEKLKFLNQRWRHLLPKRLTIYRPLIKLLQETLEKL